MEPFSTAFQDPTQAGQVPIADLIKGMLLAALRRQQQQVDPAAQQQAPVAPAPVAPATQPVATTTGNYFDPPPIAGVPTGPSRQPISLAPATTAPVNYYKAPVFGMTPNEIANVQGQAYQNATENNRAMLLAQEIKFNNLVNPAKASAVASDAIYSAARAQLEVNQLTPGTPEYDKKAAEAETAKAAARLAFGSLDDKLKEQTAKTAEAQFAQQIKGTEAKYADQKESGEARASAAKADILEGVRGYKIEQERLKAEKGSLTVEQEKSDLKSKLIQSGIDEITADDVVATTVAKRRKAEADAGKAETEAGVSAATASDRIKLAEQRVKKAMSDGTFTPAERARLSQIRQGAMDATGYDDFLAPDKRDEFIKEFENRLKVAVAKKQISEDTYIASTKKVYVPPANAKELEKETVETLPEGLTEAEIQKYPQYTRQQVIDVYKKSKGVK